MKCSTIIALRLAIAKVNSNNLTNILIYNFQNWSYRLLRKNSAPEENGT